MKNTRPNGFAEYLSVLTEQRLPLGPSLKQFKPRKEFLPDLEKIILAKTLPVIQHNNLFFNLTNILIETQQQLSESTILKLCDNALKPGLKNLVTVGPLCNYFTFFRIPKACTFFKNVLQKYPDILEIVEHATIGVAYLSCTNCYPEIKHLTTSKIMENPRAEYFILKSIRKLERHKKTYTRIKNEK